MLYVANTKKNQYMQCQYLQCFTFVFITFAIRSGMLYQLLGQILTDGSSFLPYLLVHLPFEDWPQVLYGIKIQGVAWPQIQHLTEMISEPLHYHSCLHAGKYTDPDCSWVIGRSCPCRTFWYNSYIALYIYIKLNKWI